MKIIKTMLLLIIFPIAVFSQNEEPNLSKKEIRKERPSYIGFDFGVSSSSFRDFATSPLFYKGKPLYMSLSWNKLDQKRESHMGVSYSFGKYKNYFNEHIATSSDVKTVSIYYSQLYQINRLSSEKLNVKIGGLFNATGNFRTNTALQNNGMGIEMFPTLFGSFKITTDVSRKESKNKKILFIKYTLKERTRNLAFNMNIGLVNSSYRNGYAYTGQSAVLNAPKLFDEYQLNIFSGFRMSTALDYSISLKNKNIMQLSYLWDAYKTGGELDKFEMAHHTFKVTFLFNTNNK